MALVTTVSPTVSETDHIPGIADDGDGNLAGEIDLNDIPDWGFLSTFAFPEPHLEVTPDWSGPTADISSGVIYRLEDDGQKIHNVGSVSGASLAADSQNYVYFTENDEYEIYDGDEPPSGRAVLIAVIDTGANVVNTEVRGRTPIPLPFFGPGAQETGGTPQVTTDTADAIAATEVRLRGVLDSLGGAPSVQVYFQYRETGVSSWTETAKVTRGFVGSYSDYVTGLTASTDYEFRVVALSPSGKVGFGTVETFTTAAAGNTNPVVQTDPETNIDTDGAQLNGDLTDLGDSGGSDRSSVDVFFEYRSVDGSDQGQTTATSQGSTGTFSETVNSLRSDTTYEYRAAATSNLGTVYGDYVEFTTNAGGGLSVTTDAADNIGQNSADLNGTLDNLGGATSASVNFNYRPQGDPVFDQTAIDTVTATGSFTDTIDQLVSGTTYEFQARASTSTDSATGTVETFQTLSGPGIIDDFEDGDLSEYTDVSDGPDAFVNISSSTVYEGTYSVELGGDTDRAAIVSTSGLDAYPIRGLTTTYRLYLTSASGERADFIFAAQSDVLNPDGYLVRVEPIDSRFVLSGPNGSDTVSMSFTSGVWYEVVIDFDTGGSGDISATLKESGTTVASATINDTTYNTGGIYMEQNTGSSGAQEVYFDIIQQT